jgi:hypothetical protein
MITDQASAAAGAVAGRASRVRSDAGANPFASARQRQAAALSHAPQPGADLGQHVRDRVRVRRGASLPAFPGNGNEPFPGRRPDRRWCT